jgi:two-component system sensor histidine kinase YesM
MPEETAEAVLTKEERVHKHGSGVGLVNVHNRIRLLMGEQYGLSVESEEDKGTKITVHLPKIPYTEENRKKLEGKGDGN